MGRMFFVFLSLLLIFVQFNANAALKPLKGELVTSEKLQLMWLKDANLLRTLSQKNPNLVAEIIAAAPKVNPQKRGNPWKKNNHELSERDFGLVFNDREVWYDSATWWGAHAFINYLNKINYGGFNDWRLPKIQRGQSEKMNFDFSIDGTTDLGYNISSPNSELAYLYYVELKNTGQHKEHPTQTWSGFDKKKIKTGPFLQLKKERYWYANEFTIDVHQGWSFAFSTGYQSGEQKDQMLIPWPVRDLTPPLKISLSQ